MDPATRRATRFRQLDQLPAAARKVWEELDDQFCKLDTPLGGRDAGRRYILGHEVEFFKAR